MELVKCGICQILKLSKKLSFELLKMFFLDQECVIFQRILFFPHLMLNYFQKSKLFRHKLLFRFFCQVLTWVTFCDSIPRSIVDKVWLNNRHANVSYYLDFSGF
jgi:hypothetical protein